MAVPAFESASVQVDEAATVEIDESTSHDEPRRHSVAERGLHHHGRGRPGVVRLLLRRAGDLARIKSSRRRSPTRNPVRGSDGRTVKSAAGTFTPARGASPAIHNWSAPLKTMCGGSALPARPGKPTRTRRKCGALVGSARTSHGKEGESRATGNWLTSGIPVGLWPSRSCRAIPGSSMATRLDPRPRVRIW